MPMDSWRRWSRFVLEGMVIVGSILLAFGIDAAWDDRERSRQREALLAAIGSDMAQARAEVERVTGYHRDGRGAAADLLNLPIPAPTTAEHNQRVDSLIGAAFGSTASYDAPLGAVQSLFGAGGLDVVADPELALELTAFPALVADLAREQELLQAMALELHAYLGTQGVDASLFNLDYTEVPWETGPTTASALVASPRFRGIVSMIWYRYRNTTNTLSGMQEAITRIEGLLPGG